MSTLDARICIAACATTLIGTAGNWYLDSDKNVLDSAYMTVMTLTSIGYGDHVPVTPAARAFAGALSLLGMGIFGAAMQVAATRRIAWMERAGWRSGSASAVAIVAQAALLLAVLGVGGALYSVLEERRSLLECAYFAVITGTTVGYGDYYPTTGAGKVAVMVYAVVALPVVAAATDAVGAGIVAAMTPTPPVAVSKRRSKDRQNRSKVE